MMLKDILQIDYYSIFKDYEVSFNSMSDHPLEFFASNIH